MMKLKTFAKTAILFSGIVIPQILTRAETNLQKPVQPNYIIIFTDDMGYGDLGVYGHPTIKTPHLDRMAYEGQKWTNFYVASPVCTPSRAALLTGRLPVRSGMTRVIHPRHDHGLPTNEITIAKILRENGYRTAAVGKWHLGHITPYLPTDHGFESYYGIPYSNDMDKVEKVNNIILAEKEKFESYNVPLMRNKEIIERPADQRTITKRYTEEAVSKIKEFKKGPFFIYLAHSLPHVPLFRSAKFKGVSEAGIYGDVIEEIDWSVGQIMKTLEEEGITENTLVVFTSDNGPWHIFNTHGGTGGLLQGAKAGTFEGGMRVPGIFWWPGHLKEGVIMDLGVTMDFLPTFCSLSNIELPEDRVYDGYDLSPLLFGTGKAPRGIVYYYRGNRLYAIRKGDYKAHFITQLERQNNKTAYLHNDPEIELGSKATLQVPPLLYNLSIDPSEKFNIAEEHPGIIEELIKVREEHEATIEDTPELMKK